MQWYLKTLTILAVSLFHIPLSQAEAVTNGCETQINCTVTTGNSTTTTTTGARGDAVSSERGGSGITTTTTSTNNFGQVGSGTGSGVYEQAQQAQNKSNIAMIAGLGLAAVGLPRCGTFHGWPQCIMGIAGLAAAGMASGAAGKAQSLKNELGGGGIGTANTTTDGAASTTGDTALLASQLDKLKADYAKKGYKINPDGSTTLPNGKTIDPSFSPESLAAAGLSAADINQVTAGLDGFKKKNSESDESLSVASADRGGNGMMQGQVGSGAGDSSRAGGGAGIEATSIDRDPAAWAGFYKQFGDSNIGVSQSDIFLLIENRVEKERKIMGQ